MDQAKKKLKKNSLQTLEQQRLKQKQKQKLLEQQKQGTKRDEDQHELKKVKSEQNITSSTKISLTQQQLSQQTQSQTTIELQSEKINSNPGVFKLKKKKKVVEEQEKKKQQEESEKQKKQNQIIVYIKPKELNINQTFQDIMIQSKTGNNLAILRNNLSQCNRLLQDKTALFVKKWKSLKNSNMSQADYLQQEKDLKRGEVEEIQEIKFDTIHKLHQSDIVGFETVDSIIENFKIDYFEQNKDMSEFDKLRVVFELKEEDRDTILQQQVLLLQKLMKEKNLITMNVDNLSYGKQFNGDIDDKHSFGRKLMGDAQNGGLSNTPGSLGGVNSQIQQIEQEEQEKHVKTVYLSKYFEETSFNNNNNNQKDKIEVEDGESRSLMCRLFENFDKFTTVNSNDYFILEKRKKVLLLDLKSDELFTDSNYQKEQYHKFAEVLRTFNHDINIDLEKDISDDQIQQLVEITAYIINNVHYYKKFKLDCDLLHPIDLLYIIEQVEKSQMRD